VWLTPLSLLRASDFDYFLTIRFYIQKPLNLVYYPFVRRDIVYASKGAWLRAKRRWMTNKFIIKSTPPQSDPGPLAVAPRNTVYLT
jgi:hypothetical protein